MLKALNRSQVETIIEAAAAKAADSAAMERYLNPNEGTLQSPNEMYQKLRRSLT
jgi:hypothetical protein